MRTGFGASRNTNFPDIGYPWREDANEVICKYETVATEIGRNNRVDIKEGTSEFRWAMLHFPRRWTLKSIIIIKDVTVKYIKTFFSFVDFPQIENMEFFRSHIRIDGETLAFFNYRILDVY